MDKITTFRVKLLEVLKQNLENHIENYKVAIEEYKKKAEENLLQRIQDIKDGKKLNLIFSLPVPESHEDDYNTAIGMLKMSVDEKVVLHTHEYECYVADKWPWKKNFLSNTMSYVGGRR